MTTDPDLQEAAAAAAADRVRRAIRQRQATLAAAAAGLERWGLADLEAARVLDEPPATSAKPVIGRAVTFWRKLVKHLVLAWYARPVLGQQNDFNEAAARRIAELTAAVERFERRLAALEARDRGGDPP
jgi:hypothetical protein